MDPELTSFTQTAGITLVTLMATDAWQHTRDGLTRLCSGCSLTERTLFPMNWTQVAKKCCAPARQQTKRC